MIVETVEHKYNIEVWLDGKYVGLLSDCEMDRWIWNTELFDGFGNTRRAPEAPLPEGWADECFLGRGYTCIFSLIEYGLVESSEVTFINYGPVPPRHQRSYDAF